MANISSAHGKLTLIGNWTNEAIEALAPVLECWEFYGEYGIQWCDKLSCKKQVLTFLAVVAGPFLERWNPLIIGPVPGSKINLNVMGNPCIHLLKNSMISFLK